MGVPVAVNPEILRWARETIGMSAEDAVRKLGLKLVSTETIEKWEIGEGAPTYSQLEKLAGKVYRRPIAIFFFPSPPEEESPVQSLRVDPNSRLCVMSPRMHILRRRALAMRLNLAELFDGKNPAARQIISQAMKIFVRQPIKSIAAKIRSFLDVDLKTQIEWPGTDEAASQWRKAIESAGVFVFKDAFLEDSVSGFCLHHETFPIIYVNSSNLPERQIFTMFHELAHLLLGKGSIDFRGENHALSSNARNDIDFYSPEEKKIEQFCNRFAGEFLLPDEMFRAENPPRSPDDDYLRDMSRRYKVSRVVVLRKFLDHGLIDSNFYDDKTNQWRQDFAQSKAQKRAPSGGPSYYVVKTSHLGKRYLETAFDRYYRQQINDSQLAEYLGVREERISDMQSAFLRARA